MQTLVGEHWHHLSIREALELLSSDSTKGLDVLEAKRRLKHFGPNVLTPRRERGPLLRFLLQFHQPLVYILLAAGTITALLGEWIDSSVIYGVVLVNSIVGFVQESKAVKAIAALAQLMSLESVVVRAGEKRRIPAADLVPGDLVLLQSGDKVPADLRLVQCRELRIAEAALTGESVPVEKTCDALPTDTILADRQNMAYASTLVTSGRGTGVVVATGDSTEVGQISQLIATAKELETPLTRKIAQFSGVLLYVILGLAAVTFVAGIWQGEPWFNMFMAAVALAVAAIPEGLPAAVTIVLAIGVSRMARRRAIVRKLPAVETLGSTAVICSDKTGTLTENQMTVQQIWAGGESFTVTGGGYTPSGQFEKGGKPVEVGTEGALAECLKAGLLATESQLVQKDGRWDVEGDPTEVALIVAARKAGFSEEALAKSLPRIDIIPFESERQYMATLHASGNDRETLVYVKGGVEVVLGRCVNMMDGAGGTIPLQGEEILEHAEQMASQGLRVLALGRGKLPAAAKALSHADVASSLTFLGLQGMIDPPRQEAIAAVRACQAAGISVKMITGDHVLTASAIAQQIGLDGAGSPTASPQALTGKAMAKLADEELAAAAERVAVFARVSPEQKLRLVEALQSRGHVVAMTGDGVNDAPALKQADIGVAMGITGTDVAKDAADIVLTDDNFATIEAAVEEGRGVFDNLTKFIVWTLPTNLGEALLVLTAVVSGAMLPILPVQILWINMTTAVLLGMTLAFEPKEPGIMQRPPRDPRKPLLTSDVVWRMILVGGFMLAGGFGLFEWELNSGADLTEARTVAVNVFVLIELFYLFNCRSLTRSAFQVGFFSNRWVLGGAGAMLALQVMFTYLPIMNRLFQSAPLSGWAWLRVVALGVTVFAVVGLEKWARRRALAARAAVQERPSLPA